MEDKNNNYEQKIPIHEFQTLGNEENDYKLGSHQDKQNQEVKIDIDNKSKVNQINDSHNEKQNKSDISEDPLDELIKKKSIKQNQQYKIQSLTQLSSQKEDFVEKGEKNKSEKILQKQLKENESDENEDEDEDVIFRLPQPQSKKQKSNLSTGLFNQEESIQKQQSKNQEEEEEEEEEKKSESLMIHFKTNNNEFDLLISKNSTVKDIKKQFESDEEVCKMLIEEEYFRYVLLYKKQLLEENKTLQHYNVQPWDQIEIIDKDEYEDIK